MKTPRSFSRTRSPSPLRIATASTLFVAAAAMAIVATTDTLVNVGTSSLTKPFSQNKQNEPALAVDASHPNVLVAGANDNIDMEACNAGDPTTCPFTTGVGNSGVYFSFNSGTSWIQPTYTGWTARGCLGPAACVPHFGSIGTLPRYYEAGLVTNGDPAVAFGPRRGANGKFSWANGSRLYYANLVANFSADRNGTAFKGFEAVAVSRMDAPPTGLTAAIASNKANWKAPVIVTKQNGALFSDKEQIWADNAASSPFFGNVYVCNSAFHGNNAVPLAVSVSRDGGNTWASQQVTTATSNSHHGYRTGCSIRTDSHGVVYLAVTHFGVGTPAQFALGTPGIGSHDLLKSFDGGHTWTKPVAIFAMNDACYHIDPVFNECTEDGIAGARSDLAPSPALDIANGAPTGANATNEIVDAWADGRGSTGVQSNGFNHEKVLLSYSRNGGSTWSIPAVVSTAGDRGFYAAPAISPNGRDLYVVYNAFTTPFRNDTTSTRGLVGVVRHADIGANGVPGAFSTLHRGVVGDPRGSSANSLVAEFLGDYVYAVATNAYGAGVWNDVRNAAVCPAIDTYRLSLQIGGSFPTPAPQQACVPTFGNSDIFGGSYPDPTP
jgi:hypothetical protein